MQSKAKIGSAIFFALFSVIVFHNLGINNNGGLKNTFNNSNEHCCDPVCDLFHPKAIVKSFAEIVDVIDLSNNANNKDNSDNIILSLLSI